MRDYFLEYEPSPPAAPPDTSAWTTLDGRRLLLSEIDDQHLDNIIAMVGRAALPPSAYTMAWQLALTQEKLRRVTAGTVVPRTPLSPTYQLRVDRLLDFYSPYAHLQLVNVEPVLTGVGVEPDHARQQTQEWHAARVRHLAELLVSPGYVPDALVLHEQHGLLDGHHRLIAAHVAGLEHLPAEFVGSEERRTWLEGRAQ